MVSLPPFFPPSFRNSAGDLRCLPCADHRDLIGLHDPTGPPRGIYLGTVCMFLAVFPLASLGGRPLHMFPARKHESRRSRRPAPSASVWSLDRGWSLSRGGLGPTQPGGGGGTPGRPGAQVRWETVSYPDRPCPQGNRGTCAPRWQAGPGWQERRRPWDRTEPSGREEGRRCSPRGTWTRVP